MAFAEPPAEDRWAVVELMGHVRMAGRVREVQMFGATLGRVDIPDVSAGAPKEAIARTVDFSGASIYRITYCTEEFARKVAGQDAPAPVAYRLPEHRPDEAAGEGDDSSDDVAEAEQRAEIEEAEGDHPGGVW